MTAVVRFIDESYSLEEGETLTFGRSGELVVDDGNPFLHRIVGQLTARAGGLELALVGGRIPVTFLGVSGTRAEITPGSRFMVTETGRLLFEAARARYEIEVSLSSAGWDSLGLLDSDSGSTTVEWGMIRLNFEQRRLLAVMAEPRLREGRNDIPSNKDIAARFGWTVKSVERKIDYMCMRLAQTGVAGLQGSIGRDAIDRRRRLLDHVVGFGLIDESDLDFIDLVD